MLWEQDRALAEEPAEEAQTMRATMETWENAKALSRV